MEQNEEKIRRIIEWRESLSKLPDAMFFNLMRAYIGEIKTPYNKQNLIEKLSANIRNQTIQEKIISLLNKNDILLISAVNMLPNASTQKINAFFNGSFSLPQLQEHLLNLKERLILYRTPKNTYAINPHFIENFTPFLTSGLLFSTDLPIKTAAVEKNEAPIKISPLFLATWFAFVNAEKSLCKADGTFKKRTIEQVQKIFPHSQEKKTIVWFEHFHESLKKLQLISQNEQHNLQKWTSFSLLDPNSQHAYIAAAASSNHHTYTSLQETALFILQLKNGILQNCSEQILYRLAFILGEQNTAQSEKPNLQKILSAMCDFSMLKNNNGMFSAEPETQKLAQGQISIDSSLTVTLLPHFSLSEILPLMYFLQPLRFDTAAHFEITKNSVSFAYSLNYTPQKIIDELTKKTNRALPQNLTFLLQEWYIEYTSSSLYKGMILHVSPEKAHLVENNSRFAALIFKKIADGIYILNETDEETLLEECIKAGLPISTIQTATQERHIAPFLPIKPQKIDLPEFAQNHTVISKIDSAKSENFLRHLHEVLLEKKFSKEETEALRVRIDRKVILDESQLRSESVRFEKTEAGGMDFLGKIQIVEYAVLTGSMIEIEYEDQNKIKNHFVFPVNIEKRVGDSVLKAKTETGELAEFSIGKARLIKRLRGSIFS